MKQITFLLSLLFVFMSASAQLVFHDAAEFPLLGKATNQTETRYERLPDSLKQITREPVWQLGKNSAGLAIRFRSNSTTIAARWESLNNFRMNHMTDTGIKGLDLYTLIDGTWQFVNSGRPSGKVTRATIIRNMEPAEREYLLFLPLYDGVVSLEIGVDSLSYITPPLVDLPQREKPVVCYGTSIMQGGCATRPGMAHTNILSRRLNREFINLGFSGNALLDYEIAEVMANVDAAMYILDFVPNATVEQINERARHFYNIVRTRRPDVPVLFVEDPRFPNAFFDQQLAKEIRDKNEAIAHLYQTLLQDGEKNIYFLSSEKMLGDDYEATVDGIHFTDLGFLRYAELLYPLVAKLIF
ncbi:hydrolase [Bacteroides sp. 214]|uniref:SGNH/GDSL hydrolase family protein n=1 Tax=Bacteroides sp. 214 TaxID=2302935 RepID=UPI0013D6CDF6|nr:SGNH/GDSL hydrolase family protein [Bacteroides sp. 214]NDW13178.1 hydrolase [Bacteroides sp. 214]